jgi:hypothetical protein
MSISLSIKKQFRGDVVVDMRDALVTYGLEPSHLTLTESVMMTDTYPRSSAWRSSRSWASGRPLRTLAPGTSHQLPQPLASRHAGMDRWLLRAEASPGISCLTTFMLRVGLTLDLKIVAAGIEVPKRWTTPRNVDCLGESFYFAKPTERHSLVEYLKPRVDDAVLGTAPRSCG